MKSKYDWPRGPISWVANRVRYVSIPFTWNLPALRPILSQASFDYDRVEIGGPAVALMPDYFDGVPNVTRRFEYPGVLQRILPMATKTTTGCPRRCPYCAVPRIEGDLIELLEWPDRPVIMDNNLLAASEKHFDRVMDRLVKWRDVDFNQGLDSRLMTDYHASRLSELKTPTIRLALDSANRFDIWEVALNRLLDAHVPVRSIRSYALIGFDTGPKEAWERCRTITSYGIKASIGWYHALDAKDFNVVSKEQAALGWTDSERRKITQHFYQYKKKGGKP